jgi:hypothetical protein
MDDATVEKMAGHVPRGSCAVLQRKARSWRRKPPEEKLWFAPAFLLLGLARAALLTVPFRRIAPLLGHNLQAAVAVPLAGEQEVARALHIGRAVRTAARYTPWESQCLAQAMAARVLLGVNGLPYGLYLGVSKRGESGVSAHAWVCTGPAAVTGGRGFGQFAVVGTFVSPRVAPAAGR